MKSKKILKVASQDFLLTMSDWNADDTDCTDFHGFELNKKISENPYNPRHPRSQNHTSFIDNKFIRHHFIAFR